MSAQPSLSVACIGGAHWDHKVRLSRPVELGTSNPASSARSLGGVARNVAETLAHLDCSVAIFSVLGDDPPGRELAAALARTGVDCTAIWSTPDHPTANYTAILDPDGSLVLGIADMAIYDKLAEAWAKAILPKLADYDIWVLDANIPEVGLRSLLGGPHHWPIILADPVSVAKSTRLLPVLGQIHVLFPDHAEAAAMSGLPVTRSGQALAAAYGLCAMGVDKVVVSQGPAGIAVAERGTSTLLPAAPADIVCDVTGAGDAFLAGYVYGLLHGGRERPEHFGLAAASLTVEVAATVDPDMNPERLRRRVATLARDGAR